jgi:hypothetical protein
MAMGFADSYDNLSKIRSDMITLRVFETKYKTIFGILKYFLKRDHYMLHFPLNYYK